MKIYMTKKTLVKVNKKKEVLKSLPYESLKGFKLFTNEIMPDNQIMIIEPNGKVRRFFIKKGVFENEKHI